VRENVLRIVVDFPEDHSQTESQSVYQRDIKTASTQRHGFQKERNDEITNFSWKSIYIFNDTIT